MKLKFFNPPIHGGQAEQELNQFVSGHRIVAGERRLVASDEDSFWALCSPESSVRLPFGGGRA